MNANPISYRTPSSLLVKVAQIAAKYKGQPDQLVQVTTEVKEIVPILDERVVSVIAREMGLSTAEVYSFVTFYAMLSTRPHGKYTVRMCKSASCHVNGASSIRKAIEDLLGIKVGETTEDGRFTLEYCPCLGNCEYSPCIMINKKAYVNLTPESVRDIIKTYIREDVEE